MEPSRCGRLVLASKAREDVVFATACAESAKLALTHATSLAEALELMRQDDARAALIDATDERILMSELEARKGEISPDRLHLLISPGDLSEKGRFFDARCFGHLLLRKFPEPRQNGGTYGAVLGALDRGKAIDLESFLPSGTLVRTLEIRKPSEKADRLASATRLLHEHGIPERIIALIANAWDELLLNALFDAPGSAARGIGQDGAAAGRPGFPGGATREGGPVTLRFGVGGRWIAATVTDYFGSLAKNQVLHHLTHYYNGIIDDNRDLSRSGPHREDGLGLGLALILRSGGSLHFASAPGKQTSVTILYRASSSLPILKSQFQFASIQELREASI